MLSGWSIAIICQLHSRLAIEVDLFGQSIGRGLLLRYSGNSKSLQGLGICIGALATMALQ
jgi:hypothetical protein